MILIVFYSIACFVAPPSKSKNDIQLAPHRIPGCTERCRMEGALQAVCSTEVVYTSKRNQNTDVFITFFLV